MTVGKGSAILSCRYRRGYTDVCLVIPRRGWVRYEEKRVGRECAAILNFVDHRWQLDRKLFHRCRVRLHANMTSLGVILNECQRSQAAHKKCVRMLLEKRREMGEAFLEELVFHLQHVLLVFKQDAGVERVLSFVVSFVTHREEGKEEESDEFLENMLSFLVCIAKAKDKAVRYRVCQLIAGIFNGMEEDAEVSDDLAQEIMTSMLERLQDKVPQVRAQAARALARLQDPGENATFEDDPIVEAYKHILACDKNKDVRKAVLASMAIADATMSDIVDRTSDINDEVRRVAYHVLAAKVPLQSMKIADRVLVLRRGLSDRVKRVADAAHQLLEHWFRTSAKGDVLKLLGMLDVELYEKDAVIVVEALIKLGIVKPMDAAKQAAEKGEGLRGVTIHRLLLSEEALLWRVIIEKLSQESQQHGSAAANALGATAAVEAAVASDYLEAIESALPATVEEYVAGIEQHAHAGMEFRFTTRQLLELSSRVDMTEATGRISASNLIAELMQEIPTGEDRTLVADGGDGSWERTLLKVANHVHLESSDFANFVSGIVFELFQTWLENGNLTCDGALWTQVLALLGAFWEIASNTRMANSTVFSTCQMLERLVVPALQHDNHAVRREAMKCLGLYCILDTYGSSSYLQVFYSAASSTVETSAVRAAAVSALLDLALLRGFHAIEECFPAPLDNGAKELSLLSLMMGALQERPLEESSLDSLIDDDEPRTVVAEGMAKLLMHLDLMPPGKSFSEEEAARVFSRLVLLYFDASTEGSLRLRQCLSVFFDAFASSSARHHRIICAAFLPTVRKAGLSVASKRGRGLSGTAQVSRFLLQLLQQPINPTSERETVEDTGHLDLMFKIAVEIRACAPGCHDKEGKAFIAALCKAIATVPFDSRQEDRAFHLYTLVVQLANINTIRADRCAKKDLEVLQEALYATIPEKPEPLSEEALDGLWTNAMQMHNNDMQLKDTPLPFELKEEVVERRTTRLASTNHNPSMSSTSVEGPVSDDSENEFEDCEDYSDENQIGVQRVDKSMKHSRIDRFALKENLDL